jgi:hypothetical protein
MRKPSRGVCGTCGAPVVAPTPDEFDQALLLQRSEWGRALVWVKGHLFESAGESWKLARVACRAHEGGDGRLRSP